MVVFAHTSAVFNGVKNPGISRKTGKLNNIRRQLKIGTMCAQSYTVAKNIKFWIALKIRWPRSLGERDRNGSGYWR